jgi:hypothetical protein
VADGQWHLVTLSVDRDKTDGGRVYVDSRLFWTFNPTGRKGNLDNSAALTIGHGYDQPAIGGELDEAMFFRRALSPEEISALVSAGSDGACH